MIKKTAGVQSLVEDVLDILFAPYSEDIIEEVFVLVEATPDMRSRYDQLCTDLGRNVVNQWIGRYTKITTGYATDRQVDTKRTTLTNSYSKLIS